MVFWEGNPTAFGGPPSLRSKCLSLTLNCDNLLAFQYPYVLAFEPTFVEIRNVQTGAMAQIIQGNNLRCLFADTPPSTTNSASNHYNVYQQGYGYNPYGPLDSRSSLSSNGYGTQSQQIPYPNPYMPRPPLGDGRDEILVVSDDRVMRLQMAQTARALHRG